MKLRKSSILWVHGCPELSGAYYLYDQDATLENRIWEHDDGHEIKKCEEAGVFGIYENNSTSARLLGLTAMDCASIENDTWIDQLELVSASVSPIGFNYQLNSQEENISRIYY